MSSRADTLAEIFSDLYHSEQSGVLILNRLDLEKRVYFDRGIIVFADSPVPDEDLGALLISREQISEGALAEARGTLGENPTSRELATALVTRDLANRSAVAQAMRTIVERVVRSVFLWEDGQASFEDGPQETGMFESDILTTVEVILNAVLGMAGFEAIHDAMQGLENRLRFRSPETIPVERLTLSAAHGFILSRVDGKTSLPDLISILPPGEEQQASRFVFGLLVMRVLEYDPPLGDGGFRVSDVLRDYQDRCSLELMQARAVREQYELARGQSLYDILGVTPTSSATAVEQAYERLKIQFGRDQILPKIRDKYKSEMAVIESRMIEAFLTLSQANPRASSRNVDSTMARGDVTVKDLNVRMEMDRATSKVAIDKANREADGYYAKARQCLRDGDFHNAIQFTKLAISHNAHDARYFCLLADCQARNPESRWQRMAEENYAKATRLDPWNPHYWVCLGRLYKKRGMKLRARKQFEEALKLVPNKPEIVQELASLD